ncbi:hypothetical protein ANANG_G00064180 [Anguilla anguilla]|uniref:C2H2-type domain-containing protein n=1 Tax=Anguilla anguilla TaxID=7936 RepID=A0A9D3MPI6_ANGAN|nr:hypothetical protein ANANG_G00064180 [Anguilla anguilla]
MACYYIVISSTHLSNGHFRNIKGVFRGPLCKNGNKNLDYAEKERTMAKALEDLKANFYCELCDKQYYKHQEFDNHINSYDHAHTQRLKELKQREFARNVASKSRKDERKQERALRRLHELAEQRREVQCAPGSGPKFRSTTVAVEGSSREACCEENIVGSQPATALDTGAQNDASNTSSSKQVQWPYTGKVKKQMHRQKIAFSISLPKKASIRLESSAAVFCENTEEGLAERSSRQRLRAAAAELNILSTPAVEKALNYRETIYGANTQEDLPSQPFCSVLSKDGNTVLQWPSEMLSFTRAVPSLSFSCNPLHFDFRASRNRAEQGNGGAKVSETNNVTVSQKPHDGRAAGSSGTPLHFDKHIEQAHDSDSSPARRDSHLPGSSGHQDLSAPMGGQEVKLSHEGLRFENVGGAFHPTQQGFQRSSDSIEKHCLLQAQPHRRALRPHARFHGKLKPVLSGPPIQVPSPILHPVHLSQPMSSTSITIRHTILQHHATLLQPQPPLFSQVFPITPPPLAAEMCPPGPSAFMPPPELSVVAPTGLHPVAMTLHALPRPGVFPPMLAPHPALFPLQPLF